MVVGVGRAREVRRVVMVLASMGGRSEGVMVNVMSG